MMAEKRRLLVSSRSAKLQDWLWTSYQWHAAFHIWKFTVEDFSEFFYSGGRGLDKTYNLVGLFHEL
jgi:hypothetical protein